MKILVIGTGQMGSNLARGLCRAHQVFLFNRDKTKAEVLARELHIEVLGQLDRESLKSFSMIILAVKPKALDYLNNEFNLKDLIRSDQWILSIMGGIDLQKLREHFPQGKLVASLPNICVAMGEGQMAIEESSEEEFLISPLEKELLKSELSCLGKIIFVNKGLMASATSLLGTGPAFIFLILESFIDAGVYMGISAQESKDWAIQMMEGALKMAKNSNFSTSELKHQVASPGGITIKGVLAFEEEKVRAGIMKTILATYK